MHLTADTITDEQIRGLGEDAWRVYADTRHALGYPPLSGGYTSDEMKRVARARCAEILNARAEGK